MKPIAILVALALALSGGMALAQVKASDDEVEEIVLPRTFIDYVEAAKIEGKLYGPSGQYWVGKQQVRFDSQIRVRQNFTPEVVGSADAL